jgi:hypothetical protein
VTLAEPTTQLRWRCAPLGSEIECSPRVLHTVCLEATLGLRKLAKGGLEVGGVLFGARTEGLIRVLAVRPLGCEHRFGPSFVLSDTDEARLQELLTNYKTDGELASLEILGCYFSHSRHGAALTDRDLELCDRYFSGTDQIAVTLIPSATGGIQGTLLARDAQGTFVSCHEFEYSVLNKAPSEAIRTPQPATHRKPLSLVMAAALSRQEGIQTERLPPDPSVDAVQHAAESEPRQPVAKVSTTHPPETQHGALKARSRLLVGLLVLVACWPNRSVPVTQIPLRLTDSGHKLVIHWDAEQPAVREAALGMLDIRDGDQEPQHVSIGPELLRRGWTEYERKSELVRISFSLVGRGVTVSESTIYFAPQHTDVAPAPLEASAVKLEAKFQDSIAPPVRQTPEPIDPEGAAPLSRNLDRQKVPRPFHAPLVEVVARSGGPTNAKPPILPDAPVLRLDSETASLPFQRSLALSLPAPHPAKLPSASGRLIWTGHLPKRSMLSLSAQGASLGYLNGWLPRSDVHVEVRPAELMEGGMVIFTKDESLRPESPSLSNGWNTVLYKSDIARASELEILDAPGPSNDWSHLMLRDGIRSLSVIVIDWRTEKN